jgi:tetratricopeptide (TPR) repeat protein
LYQALAGEFPAVPDYRSRLATGEADLADLLDRLGRPTEADRLLRDSLALHERLAADFPAEPAHRWKLAAARSRLGTLLRDAGRAAEAERLMRDALTLTERLVAEFPDVPAYRLALMDRRVGVQNVLTDHGRKADLAVLQAERDSVAFYQRQDDGSPASRDRLAVSQFNLGRALFHAGQIADAEAATRQALTSFEYLAAEHPSVPRYRQLAAKSLEDLGDLYRFTGRPADALAQARRGLAIREKLAAEFPTVPDHRLEVSNTHFSLAIAHRTARQTAEAAAHHNKALVLREKLVADYPDVPRYRLALAKSHTARGIVLVSLRRHDEAERGYRWAVGHYEKLLADHPGAPDYLSLKAAALDNTAESLIDRGDPAGAKPLVEQALALELEALKGAPRHPVYLRFLSSHYEVLGRAQVLLGEHAGAAAAARDLARQFADDGHQLRIAAGLLARCATVIEKDERSSQGERAAAAGGYVAEALELLRQAVRKGFADAADIRDDPHLAPLHGETFLQIVADAARAKK